jgi:hypothetical protein
MGSQSALQSRISGLPDQFPVGTRYVIEGRGGRIHRYLEFPDGRHVELPAELAGRGRSRSGRSARGLRRKAAVRKF